MSLHPQDIPPVPEETRRVAHTPFPRGNIYMRLRDELGTIYHDQLFAPLFPTRGQPAASPWRLALATVMQFAEDLSDRQGADAVRRRIDSKYALSYDVEVRYCTKRGIAWVGYKVHLTETLEDGQPHLITGVMTTPATTPDCVMDPPIQNDLATRDLLPSIHLLDGGYVDAEFLVTAQSLHQIDVVDPPFGSCSHQHRRTSSNMRAEHAVRISHPRGSGFMPHLLDTRAY